MNFFIPLLSRVSTRTATTAACLLHIHRCMSDAAPEPGPPLVEEGSRPEPGPPLGEEVIFCFLVILFSK
jgi:hypothetical protein